MWFYTLLLWRVSLALLLCSACGGFTPFARATVYRKTVQFELLDVAQSQYAQSYWKHFSANKSELEAAEDMLNLPREALTSYYHVINDDTFYLESGGTITIRVSSGIQYDTVSYQNLIASLRKTNTESLPLWLGNSFELEGTKKARHAAHRRTTRSVTQSSATAVDAEYTTGVFESEFWTVPTTFFFLNHLRLHCLYNAYFVNQWFHGSHTHTVQASTAAESTTTTTTTTRTTAPIPISPLVSKTSCKDQLPPAAEVIPDSPYTFVDEDFMESKVNLRLKIFDADTWFRLTRFSSADVVQLGEGGGGYMETDGMRDRSADEEKEAARYYTKHDAAVESERRTSSNTDRKKGGLWGRLVRRISAHGQRENTDEETAEVGDTDTDKDIVSRVSLSHYLQYGDAIAATGAPSEGKPRLQVNYTVLQDPSRMCVAPSRYTLSLHNLYSQLRQERIISYGHVKKDLFDRADMQQYNAHDNNYTNSDDDDDDHDDSNNHNVDEEELCEFVSSGDVEDSEFKPSPLKVCVHAAPTDEPVRATMPTHVRAASAQSSHPRESPRTITSQHSSNGLHASASSAHTVASFTIHHSFDNMRLVAVVLQCSAVPLQLEVEVEFKNKNDNAESLEHNNNVVEVAVFCAMYGVLWCIFCVMLFPCRRSSRRRCDGDEEGKKENDHISSNSSSTISDDDEEEDFDFYEYRHRRSTHTRHSRRVLSSSSSLEVAAAAADDSALLSRSRKAARHSGTSRRESASRQAHPSRQHSSSSAHRASSHTSSSRHGDTLNKACVHSTHHRQHGHRHRHRLQNFHSLSDEYEESSDGESAGEVVYREGIGPAMQQLGGCIVGWFRSHYTPFMHPPLLLIVGLLLSLCVCGTLLGLMGYCLRVHDMTRASVALTLMGQIMDVLVQSTTVALETMVSMGWGLVYLRKPSTPRLMAVWVCCMLATVVNTTPLFCTTSIDAAFFTNNVCSRLMLGSPCRVMCVIRVCVHNMIQVVSLLQLWLLIRRLRSLSRGAMSDYTCAKREGVSSTSVSAAAGATARSRAHGRRVKEGGAAAVLGGQETNKGGGQSRRSRRMCHGQSRSRSHSLDVSHDSDYDSSSDTESYQWGGDERDAGWLRHGHGARLAKRGESDVEQTMSTWGGGGGDGSGCSGNDVEEPGSENHNNTVNNNTWYSMRDEVMNSLNNYHAEHVWREHRVREVPKTRTVGSDKNGVPSRRRVSSGSGGGRSFGATAAAGGGAASPAASIRSAPFSSALTALVTPELIGLILPNHGETAESRDAVLLMMYMRYRAMLLPLLCIVAFGMLYIPISLKLYGSEDGLIITLFIKIQNLFIIVWVLFYLRAKPFLH